MVVLLGAGATHCGRVHLGDGAGHGFSTSPAKIFLAIFWPLWRSQESGPLVIVDFDVRELPRGPDPAGQRSKLGFGAAVTGVQEQLPECGDDDCPLRCLVVALLLCYPQEITVRCFELRVVDGGVVAVGAGGRRPFGGLVGQLLGGGRLLRDLSGAQTSDA